MIVCDQFLYFSACQIFPMNLSGLTSYGFAVYALVATRLGKGVPMAYIILSKDDTDNLVIALNALKNHMQVKGVPLEPK